MVAEATGQPKKLSRPSPFWRDSYRVPCQWKRIIQEKAENSWGKNAQKAEECTGATEIPGTKAAEQWCFLASPSKRRSLPAVTAGKLCGMPSINHGMNRHMASTQAVALP